MNKKLVLVAPCLAMLAACGGSGTNPAVAPNLTSAIQGSVVLSADNPAEATSVDEILSVNFTDSAVGSSVTITEGDFAGISLTKVEAIGGKETILLSSPDDVELSSALVGSLEDDLKVAIQFIDVDGIEENRPSETINGTQVYFYNSTNSEGTTARQTNEVGIGDLDNGVSATMSITELAGEATLILGARRHFEGVGATDNYQEKATGTFEYGGLTTVFGVDDSYTTETASMTVNFEQSSGTFNATNFTPDEDAAPKTITIENVLSLDNSTGFISSTSGTLTVGTESGSIAVNGVLSENNDAVAGVLVPTDGVDGIIGGLFALPQNPPL
jgi:hypothetical protein